MAGDDGGAVGGREDVELPEQVTSVSFLPSLGSINTDRIGT